MSRAAAVAAAERGWAVFPVTARAKKPPLVEDWERRACSDPGRVGRYWPGHANVGISCGPSGLVVVDMDTHGDLPDEWQLLPGIRDGRDVLAQLCEWAGQPWPATYWVTTASGGWHFYFTAPEGSQIRNSAGLIGPQVDVRASGGYVVGAGSAVDGKPYEVVDDRPPAPLPGWLARMLTRKPDPPASRRTSGPPGARLRGLAETVRTSQSTYRTGTLVWAAFKLREMAIAGEADPEAAGELLVQAAVEAGIRGGERYARQQVRHVLEGDR